MKLTEMTALELVVDYQLRNRQVGHTAALLNGILDSHFTETPIIIVANGMQAQHLELEIVQRGYDRGRARDMVMIIDHVKRGGLKDIKGRPLVVDNFALYQMALEVDEQRREILMKQFNEAEQNRS